MQRVQRVVVVARISISGRKSRLPPYGGATRPSVFSLARYAYANDCSEREREEKRERETHTHPLSLFCPPSLSLSLCVCEVRDCRSRRKCPLATIGAREGASAESARLKAGPLQRPAAPFQRTLPTNTLCLARAPS